MSVARAVIQFALGGLIALVAVAMIGTVVLRRAATAEAIRDARVQGSLAGHGIVENRLDAAYWGGNQRARAELDRVVRRYVLTDGVVRVKIWNAGGQVVYSDEPRLVGVRFPLGGDEREILTRGGADAELSELSLPENRFERRYGKLLEVYVQIRTPSGRPLLFETYKRFSSVTASGRRVWTQFLPPLVFGLVLFGIVQIPLAWSMARRLREGQRHSEALLRKVLAASDDERRRIAGSLHDGVVQDLAGVSYSLAATADRLARSDSHEASEALRSAAQQSRQSIRGLRAALVDIYPPDLRRSGLAAALQDLASSLEQHGIAATVGAAPDVALDADRELVVYRVAQEALRNIIKHSGASHAEIDVARHDDHVVLTVRDDGHGYAPPRRPPDDNEHMGLMMLHDLAADAGGTLEVDTTEGQGTTVRLEVPTP